MKSYVMTNEELEDNADVVKVVVLTALVLGGHLTKEKADEWAEEHTILHKKKNIFRTITDKWAKEKVEDSQYYYIVVSKK